MEIVISLPIAFFLLFIFFEAEKAATFALIMVGSFALIPHDDIAAAVGIALCLIANRLRFGLSDSNRKCHC